MPHTNAISDAPVQKVVVVNGNTEVLGMLESVLDAGRYDMVWGMFVFGPYFGGGFLRMQPAGAATGLVNTSHGAEVGVLLHVDPA